MRRRQLFRVLGALLLAGFVTPALAADPAGDPGQFVTDLAHKAFFSAGSAALALGEREQILKGLLDEEFDITRISSFVTGRYWQKASEANRLNFAAVFRDYLVGAFVQRFADYDGSSVRVVGVPRQGANHILVETEITERSSGRPLTLEWRLIETDGYRVIDVSVGGISMATTQREEFASILTRNAGDLPDLVRQLQINVTAR